MWNTISNGFLQFFKNIPETWDALIERVGPSLQIMGKGMLGIFVVMTAIAIIVFLFTKIIKKN